MRQDNWNVAAPAICSLVHAWFAGVCLDLVLGMPLLSWWIVMGLVMNASAFTIHFMVLQYAIREDS